MRNPEPNVPGVAGKSCPASTGIEWDVGKPIKNGSMVAGVDSPTPTDFGSTLENGESGAKIDCTVRKSGAFNARGEGLDPIIMKPNGFITFDFNGTAKPNGTPVENTAKVTLYTPPTYDVQTNPGFPDCIITAVHEQAPGALWADFDCPALTRLGTPSTACHASGTIVFEYCRTGEED